MKLGIKDYREEIKALFNETEYDAILRFKDLIYSLSKDENYVIVSMARKATCFIDCLQRIGLLDLQTPITSNRALDMNVDCIKNKKIAIIDNIVISGTTIRQTRDKLVKLGIDDTNIEAYALSIDSDTFNPEITSINKTFLLLNHYDTIQLSKKIVDAISLTPRPYSIDFPLYRRGIIQNNDFNNIVKNRNWISRDVTTPLQAKNYIVSYSFIPNLTLIKKLQASLGVELPENSIYKIRFYGKRFRGNIKQTIRFNLVPIVALNDLKISDMENMFNFLCEMSKKIGIDICKYFCQGKRGILSKYRLVNFIIANRLAMLWLEEHFNVLDTRNCCILDHNSLRFLFMPNSIFDVSVLSRDRSIKLGDLKHISNNVSVERYDIDSQMDFYAYYDAVIKHFKKRQQETELPLRNKLFTSGNSYYLEIEKNGNVDRLKEGCSIEDMSIIMSSISDNVCWESKLSIISQILDLSIDQGFIVPINSIKGDIISRAYRYGEDIALSDKDYKLFGLMLYNYACAINEEHDKKNGTVKIIGKTQIEKMLSIFLRIGVQKGIFLKHNNLTYTPNVYSIHYSIHGAVVDSVDCSQGKYKVKWSEKGTLFDTLRLRGYIPHMNYIKPKKAYELIISKPDEESLTLVNKEYIESAEEIGNLFGKIRKNKQINLDDLIIIASIQNEEDVINALAAEVNYISENIVWLTTYYHYFNNVNAINKIKSIKEAIKSARKKFDAYTNDHLSLLIDKVSKVLQGKDRSIWDGIWKERYQKVHSYSYESDKYEIVKILIDWINVIDLHIKTIEIGTKIKENLSKGIENEYIEEQKKVLRNIVTTKRKTNNELIQLTNAVESIFSNKYSKNNHLLVLKKSIKELIDETNKIAIKNEVIMDENTAEIQLRPMAIFDFVFYTRVPTNTFRDEYKTCTNKINDFIREIKDSNTEHWEEDNGEFKDIYVVSRSKNIFKSSLKLAETIVNMYSKHNITIPVYLHWNIDEPYVIRQETYGSKQYNSKKFKRLSNHVKNSVHINNTDFSYICIVDGHFLLNKRMDIINEQFPFYKHYSIKNKQKLEFNDEASVEYILIKKDKDTDETNIDICIITVIEHETKALLNELRKNYNKFCSLRDDSLPPQYIGVIKGDNDKEYTVATIQAFKKGMLHIQPSIEHLKNEYKPKYIFILGCSGNIGDRLKGDEFKRKKELKIGDVHFIDKGWIYEKGEVIEVEGNPIELQTIESVEADTCVQNIAQRFFNEVGHHFSDEDKTFRCEIGGIATGGWTVKSSVFFKLDNVLRSNSEIFSVDQETYASLLHDKLKREAIYSGCKDFKLINIRCITDNADKEMDEKKVDRVKTLSRLYIVLRKLLPILDL